MSNITFDSDRAMSIFGVTGRLTHRTVKPGKAPELWFKQRWISAKRSISGYGAGGEMEVEIRFDDELGNGRNSFSITASVWTTRSRKHRDIEAGGCLHEEIEKVFPELSPLIKFHLFDTNGPMHYLSNAVYLAGDRDCNGLRKGEKREIQSRDGLTRWELIVINAPGVLISSTFTGDQYREREHLPLFIIEKYAKGEKPVTPALEWVKSYCIGEGKARELDAARRVARWPDATDEELMQEPDALKAALTARLPALLAEFRETVESAGFYWSPSDFPTIEGGENEE